METVAQNVDFRLDLTNDLFSEIDSKTYLADSTIKADRIILPRKRLLTLANLIVMIIRFKTSVQRELDSFFKELSNGDFNIREVTKGACSQARAKLNPWAFKRLNEVAVASFYKGAPYHKWHGRRVLAFDETRVLLPNHPSVIKNFGQHGMEANGDCKRSMAIGSILYDVLNQIAIDAAMAPYASSETSLLLGHLPKIKESDLLLLDRGYPSYWLLHLLHAQKIDFCVRLKSDLWLQVRDFTKSGEKERIVSFDLPKRDSKKLDIYEGKGEKAITCRLIKD